MSEARDVIKYNINQTAKQLINTSRNEEELIERVEILLTLKHNLEAEKAELIEVVDEFVKSSLIYQHYMYDDAIKLLNKYKESE